MTDEIQNDDKNLKEAIDEASEQKEEINIELTETLKQVESLDAKIEEYQSKIEELQVKLKDTQKNIKETKEKLENIEENYILQKEALSNRLVVLYESGEIRYLDFLLSSNSLSEFISNYYLIAEIAKYDTNLLENIDRFVNETKEAFNDGSHIIYVNGKYKGNDDIGKLMSDFNCKSANKMQFEALANSVRHFKETKKGRMKSSGLQLCEDRSGTENVKS